MEGRGGCALPLIYMLLYTAVLFLLRRFCRKLLASSRCHISFNYNEHLLEETFPGIRKLDLQVSLGGETPSFTWNNVIICQAVTRPLFAYHRLGPCFCAKHSIRRSSLMTSSASAGEPKTDEVIGIFLTVLPICSSSEIQLTRFNRTTSRVWKQGKASDGRSTQILKSRNNTPLQVKCYFSKSVIRKMLLVALFKLLKNITLFSSVANVVNVVVLDTLCITG